MLKKALVSTLCFFVLLSSHVAVSAQELTGRQIMDESSNRHDLPREYEELDMNLSENGAVFEQRELRRYSLEGDDGLFKYLTVFDGPAGVEGVALLSWQNKGRPDDQWTYLPAVSRKLKRTAGSSKRKPFLGTDFTYEDMTSDDRDDFTYERLEDSEINGEPTFVVKAVPANKEIARETGYAWRIFNISKETFFVIQVDFYDRRENHSKVQVNYDPVVVIDQAMRPKRTVMTTLENNTSTEMIIKSRSLDEDAVDEGMFEHRWIKTGRYMR